MCRRSEKVENPSSIGVLDEKVPGGGVGGTDFLEGNNGKEIHLFD